SIVAKHLRVPLPVVNSLLLTPGILTMLGAPADGASFLTAISSEGLYTLLEKSVYAVSKLHLIADEISLPPGSVLRPCAAFDWAKLVQPPVDSDQERWLRFADWRNFIDLVNVRGRLAA